MNAFADTLDAALIRARLSPRARAVLGDLDVVACVASTNDELLRRPNPAQNTVLIAETQSAGRGRRGRQWLSLAGAGLYLSVFRHLPAALARHAGLPLAVAVAVCEALAAAGIDGLGLKWPNDLLRHGRKLGGILIESGGPVAGPATAVIGLGLNLCLPPEPGIDQPWADLSDRPPAERARNRLAALLLDHLLSALDLFEIEGLAPFRMRWERFDVLAGRPIRVLDGRHACEGTALGIAADGALWVAHGDGVRCHYAGEISVRLREDAEP